MIYTALKIHSEMFRSALQSSLGIQGQCFTIKNAVFIIYKLYYGKSLEMNSE